MAEPFHTGDASSILKIHWSLCFDSLFSLISIDRNTFCRLQCVVEWRQMYFQFKAATAQTSLHTFLEEYQNSLFCKKIPCRIGDLIDGRIDAHLHQSLGRKDSSIAGSSFSPGAISQAGDFMDWLWTIQKLIKSGLLCDSYSLELGDYRALPSLPPKKDFHCCPTGIIKSGRWRDDEQPPSCDCKIRILRYNQANELIDSRVTTIN